MLVASAQNDKGTICRARDDKGGWRGRGKPRFYEGLATYKRGRGKQRPTSGVLGQSGVELRLPCAGRLGMTAKCKSGVEPPHSKKSNSRFLVASLLGMTARGMARNARERSKQRPYERHFTGKRRRAAALQKKQKPAPAYEWHSELKRC